MQATDPTPAIMTTDQIIPRDIRFNVSRYATRNWLCGDPDQTAFVDGLSALLPEGERYFVKAVRHYQGSITDPDLRERVTRFVAQEANHSREHIDYNNGMRNLGYNVDVMEARLRAKLDITKSPLVRLAVTCCIEHFTTIFSDPVLRHSSYLERAPVTYREIWQWHALEELEHKAVPFDVFTFVTRDMPAWKRYVFRTAVMLKLTNNFIVQLYSNVRDIFHTDGKKLTLLTWIRWLWKMAYNPGLVRRSLPNYFRYYLPGFHPEDCTDKELMQRWRENYHPAAVTENQ